MSTAIAPFQVEAFNIAAASENKIHDDTVASRFGFSGGLVPGVAVFGYMAHQPVARWRRDWLTRGSATCRFGQPVYDGALAIVDAQTVGDVLELQVNSQQRLCATGSAALPASAIAPDPAAFQTAPVPDDRPAADQHSLAAGTVLCTRPHSMDRAQARDWHAELRETDPIYETEALMHPATLLRIANWALTQNVRLGPWIHTASEVQNYAPMPVGAALSARAVVSRNYNHKGHRLVDLDVLVLIDEKTVAARILHTAIYLPRQVAEAAAAG